MAKYKFSVAERFGVWNAYDGICFWCRAPLVFQEMTVDHIIPENIGNDRGKLESIKTMYQLGERFEINNYSNWVPSHGNCNSRKGEDLFSPSPAMIAVLNTAAKRADTAAGYAENAISDKQKGRILGRLASALESELVSREEVEVLFRGLDHEPSVEGVEHGLAISPHWTVVRNQNGVATVTDGHRAGTTPVSANPHHSWVCPTCGNYGPWNGVICLSCGMMSDPWG